MSGLCVQAGPRTPFAPSQPQPEVLAARVGALACQALLDEPYVWPRFGLVGPEDPGAHQDMDYADLARSARVLEPFFVRSARLGLSLPRESLEAVLHWRWTGVEAEQRMLATTGGVNTHKGAIFLLGLLCFSCTRALRTRSRAPLSLRTLDLGHRGLAAHLAQELTLSRSGLSETYGQWAHRRYGWSGMRHTVISNFASLRAALDGALSRPDLPIPSRMALARHLLLVESQDSNLVKRAGWRSSQRLLAQARRAMALGSVASPEGCAMLTSIDREMADEGWSASGCGDLLAAALFLWRLDLGALGGRA